MSWSIAACAECPACFFRQAGGLHHKRRIWREPGPLRPRRFDTVRTRRESPS